MRPEDGHVSNTANNRTNASILNRKSRIQSANVSYSGPPTKTSGYKMEQRGPLDLFSIQQSGFMN